MLGLALSRPPSPAPPPPAPPPAGPAATTWLGRGGRGDRAAAVRVLLGTVFGSSIVVLVFCAVIVSHRGRRGAQHDARG